MKIEKMSIMDLEQIKDNLQSDFDDFWNSNILEKELQNDNSYMIVVKDENNEIVGFAGIQFILDEADITNIVTKKSARNRGIGTILLKELINVSEQKDCKRITLEVNENNSIALKLYKNIGFVEIGQRKKYYNGKETAIIMEKKIEKCF
ncbi:MAG: ribosomal protein S18-alanine N-acetyltransferase [Clostridia bacterium]|nr:ribosomal protein S18-alanine N-acetyltransferase [Clostridia bacterium]